ncbi:MAG: hypothetical protein M1114_06010 [Candidatus Dependentiae bacterium]|nr:hypothetical protein [Candidatus Dependentiae bacterium]
MKHISYFFLLIFLTVNSKITLPPLYFSSEPEHNAYAQQWTSVLFDNDSVLKASEEDIQIILNILYFSAARSQINIDAQESALTTLQKIWEGWANIIARRRNPSKPIIYTHATLDITKYAELHEKNLMAHEKICRLYDVSLEQTLKNKIFKNGFLINHITFLRDQARRTVLQAVLDIRPELETLKNYIETKKIAVKHDTLKITRSHFVDHLLGSIPLCAYQAFIATDKLFVKTSELHWSTLHTTNKITNSIWHKIEHARGTFYAMLYQALYLQAELRNIKPIVIFSEYGLLPVAKRKIPLPRPEQK